MSTDYWARHIVQCRKQAAKLHKRRKLRAELAAVIEQLLRWYLSPEQVSGHMKQHHDLLLGHETIYRYVYQDAIRRANLKPFLR